MKSTLPILCSLLTLSVSGWLGSERTNVYLDESENSTMIAPAPSPTPTPNRSKLIPPPGRTLFIVGQDIGSIDEYVQSMGLIPSGVTGYTSLQRLEGLTTATDFGAGVHHFDYLAQEYPTSVLVLGFYAVNFLDPIVEGRAEGRIEKFLDYLERHDRPLYLRFGYEFDGPWNYYEPEKFKLAWRVSYEKMKERGIDHTAMVWQSSTHCAGTYKDLPLTAWYPGDEYVDWIGLSYFMPEECDAEPVLDLLQFAREHQKPVMIAESTPQGYDLRESTFSLDGHEFVKTSPEAIWDQWYQPYFDLIYSHSDVIRA
ncbi:MAG: glycosyl hydrolase, partial [Candidatus Promineifilaceae bacterium]